MIESTLQVMEVCVQCPRCGVKFVARRPPDFPDTGFRDSELRHIPSTPAQKYEHCAICTCPSCGKADWVRVFEVIDEQVFVHQASMTTHLQFRNAAIEADKEGRDTFTIGMLYLYGAWCADDAMAFPQGREYRRRAASYLKRCLADGTCPMSERAAVNYLVGEVYRRSSSFAESFQHFVDVMPRLPQKFAAMGQKVMRLAEMQNSEAIPMDT